MESDEAVAWLGRKVGWGFDQGQFADWQELGPAKVIDQLVDGDAFGVRKRPDPFAEVEIDPERLGRSGRLGVTSWIEHAATSPRPLETFMEFFWSDYFAVSLRSVRPTTLMFPHMNLLAKHCLGNFSELLRAVTVDGAMLRFLDGATNSRNKPNENYGRELLELYSVGVGNFTEDDVKAASRALTGWVMRRRDDGPRFVERRHDPTQQVLLGVSGVHDVDTTVDAVLSHPATASQVVHKLATAFLGDRHEPVFEQVIADFGQNWELKPVVRALLQHAIEVRPQPTLVEPLAWYVTTRRLGTRAPQRQRLNEFFRSSGQIPMLPPNVGGFPGPAAYLSTSATIARFNFASHLAERSERRGALMELTDDVDRLGERLGLVGGFSTGTRQALNGLERGVDRLAAALAAPDLVVV